LVLFLADNYLSIKVGKSAIFFAYHPSNTLILKRLLIMRFDTVRNYYEKLVGDRVAQVVGKKSVDIDYLEDVTCVALNHLPPRYIRHEVDMIFYLSPVEREEMEKKVDSAIVDAMGFIKENRKRGK